MVKPQTFRQLAERARLQRLGATDPDTYAYSLSLGERTKTAICQILERTAEAIHLYCSRLEDDSDNGSHWVPLRPDLPDWLPVGVPFTATLLAKILSWESLMQTPWTFREINFSLSPAMPDQDYAAFLNGLEQPAIPTGTIQLDWSVARRAVAEIVRATDKQRLDDSVVVPDWVIDIASNWTAKVRLSRQANGQYVYPLLTAFEDVHGWLPAGIKIEWINETDIFEGSTYFLPEYPEKTYKVVALGQHADRLNDDSDQAVQVLYKPATGGVDRLYCLSVQEFKDRFLLLTSQG